MAGSESEKLKEEPRRIGMPRAEFERRRTRVIGVTPQNVQAAYKLYQVLPAIALPDGEVGAATSPAPSVK